MPQRHPREILKDTTAVLLYLVQICFIHSDCERTPASRPMQPNVTKFSKTLQLLRQSIILVNKIAVIKIYFCASTNDINKRKHPIGNRISNATKSPLSESNTFLNKSTKVNSLLISNIPEVYNNKFERVAPCFKIIFGYFVKMR